MTTGPGHGVFHTLLLMLFSTFTFSREGKTQLSTFKPSSSSSSHGSFMTLHLVRITYRESYPPWGKSVRRELSIMSFEGHLPIFLPVIYGPHYPDLCVCPRGLFSFPVRLDFLGHVPEVLFPMQVSHVDCVTQLVGEKKSCHLDISSHGPNMLHDKSQLFSDSRYLLFSFLGGGCFIRNKVGLMCSNLSCRCMKPKHIAQYPWRFSFQQKSWNICPKNLILPVNSNLNLRSKAKWKYIHG